MPPILQVPIFCTVSALKTSGGGSSLYREVGERPVKRRTFSAARARGLDPLVEVAVEWRGHFGWSWRDGALYMRIEGLGAVAHRLYTPCCHFIPIALNTIREGRATGRRRKLDVKYTILAVVSSCKACTCFLMDRVGPLAILPGGSCCTCQSSADPVKRESSRFLGH